MLIFKKILCPVDLSEASREGLHKAVQLASPGETEICVIHVMPPTERATERALAPNAPDEAVRRAAAVKMLSEVIAAEVPAQISSRPLLKEGDAAKEIVGAAHSEEADLIVLTTHGGQGWKLGALGNVAAEVVRSARCPVLSVSGPESSHAKIGQNRAEAIVAATASMRPELEIVSNHRLYLDGD